MFDILAGTDVGAAYLFLASAWDGFFLGIPL